jgi:hypothetical protein
MVHVFLGPIKKSPIFKFTKNHNNKNKVQFLSQDVSLWEQPQGKNQKRINNCHLLDMCLIEQEQLKKNFNHNF